MKLSARDNTQLVQALAEPPRPNTGLLSLFGEPPGQAESIAIDKATKSVIQLY